MWMTNGKQQIRKGAGRGSKSGGSGSCKRADAAVKRRGKPKGAPADRSAPKRKAPKRPQGNPAPRDGGLRGARQPAPSAPSNAPFCPVAARCGACQSVNVPYGRQLAEKDRFVAQLFADVAPADALRPILGMEDPYGYRNKVTSPYAPVKGNGRGSAGSGKSGKLPASGRERGTSRGEAAARRGGREDVLPARSIACGMYAAGTHRIVDTRDCLVENPVAKDVVQAIRRLMPRFRISPYDEDAGEGFLRHAVIRVGHESEEVLVTLVTNGEAFPGSREFCRELVRCCPAITTVVQNVNTRQTNVILGEQERVLYGPGFILDTLCGLSFRISSQSFYQVNAVQTEVLYRTAVGLARLKGDETAIDAYCGTGTIGLVAAKAGAARVVGVDTVASAIRDAWENARHNGVGNAEFVVGDAGKFMEELAAQRAEGAGEGPFVLLMDPPRAGASEEFLRSAAELSPERIVYISCNPATQVRDIRLLQQAGYAVRAVQPVDMFPHTPHVETVALLERGGATGAAEVAAVLEREE